MRAIIGLLFLSAILSSQPGWQTVKDRTGACQLSVPGNWSVLSTPGHVSSPSHLGTTVISGNRAFRPFHESTLKMLGIDKLFENSAQRIFYSTKPHGTPPLMTYHVEAPGRTMSCIAEITSTPSYSLEEVKKIAASLSAAH